jgi:cytochrome oxidase Cu insertion factor (SCO1/SenC/PrrC family)
MEIISRKWIGVLVGFFFIQNGFGQINFKTYPTLPAYKLVSSSGETFTSSSILQKKSPLVVIYFSPTCSHCQQQAEDITSNMNQFKDAQFLFVTSYPQSDTKPFLNQYAIEKFKNITFGYDSTFSMGKFYLLESLPGIFIYNKNGELKTFFSTNVKPANLYAAIFEN